MPYMSYDYHEVEDMEFEELLRQRYATKVFDGRKVEDKKLDSILEMIRLTPSAINLQPWKIKVVREDRTKQALSPCSLGQKQITTCSDLLVFCADTDLHGHALKVLEGMRAAGVPQEDISDMEGFLHGNIGQLTPEQRLAVGSKERVPGCHDCNLCREIAGRRFLSYGRVRSGMLREGAEASGQPGAYHACADRVPCRQANAEG